MLYRFLFGFLTLMKLICFRYLLSLPGKNEYAQKKEEKSEYSTTFFQKSIHRYQDQSHLLNLNVLEIAEILTVFDGGNSS